MINTHPPFKGLNIVIVPIKGRGVINQGLGYHPTSKTLALDCLSVENAKMNCYGSPYIILNLPLCFRSLMSHGAKIGGFVGKEVENSEPSYKDLARLSLGFRT